MIIWKVKVEKQLLLGHLQSGRRYLIYSLSISIHSYKWRHLFCHTHNAAIHTHTYKWRKMNSNSTRNFLGFSKILVTYMLSSLSNSVYLNCICYVVLKQVYLIYLVCINIYVQLSDLPFRALQVPNYAQNSFTFLHLI